MISNENNTHYIEGKIETAKLPNGKYYWKAFIYDNKTRIWDQVAKGTNKYTTEDLALENARLVTINHWIIVKEVREPIKSETKKTHPIISALKALLK